MSSFDHSRQAIHVCYSVLKIDDSTHAHESVQPANLKIDNLYGSTILTDVMRLKCKIISFEIS